jgi:predicted Zn-dependent peptidase
MPDRTVAPAVQQIEQVAIPEAIGLELDNGVPLYYVNAGKQPVMRLEIVFNAGKWFEHIPGQSYFTGTMLTEGTERYSASEIAAFFDELGAFTEVTCGFDRITLSVHLLSRHLQTILPLIREIVQAPGFKESELKSLKARRKQKLLVDLKKNSFQAARNFTGKIFGPDHPYGKVLNPEDISSLEPETISSFYQERMQGNFEVILSGMITEQHIDSINNILGNDSRNAVIGPNIAKPVYFPTNSIIEKDDSLQSSIRVGIPFINRQHPEFPEMLVVNEILGGYFGSRLMRNIREEKGYTYGIRSTVNCLTHAGLWAVSTDVKKEFRRQTLEEITREIEILRSQPVPEAELETVKNYMLGTFVSSLDTPFALADKFKTIHHSGLKYDYFQSCFNTVRNISGERIMALSQQYLLPESFTTVVVG